MVDLTHNRAMPANLVQWRRFLDDLTLTLETILLLSETRLQNGVGRKHNVVFGDLAGVRAPIAAMPDEDLQTFGVSFDLVLPLHYGDSWTIINTP